MLSLESWWPIQVSASGGSKGAQILSISCSFWENMAKSYVGAPLGSWGPLLGEILDLPLSAQSGRD